MGICQEAQAEALSQGLMMTRRVALASAGVSPHAGMHATATMRQLTTYMQGYTHHDRY